MAIWNGLRGVINLRYLQIDVRKAGNLFAEMMPFFVVCTDPSRNSN
jgi:hypothetical protein